MKPNGRTPWSTKLSSLFLKWALVSDRRLSFYLFVQNLIPVYWFRNTWARWRYFLENWVLTTNHRRLAVLYFAFIAVTGLVGLALATMIRIELAYPGQSIFATNAERYLTIASVHGIVMVFFVVIPAIFGAFANFLLPTQLGIRDVAFPRLNSFMFWLTPSGFILLLHLLVAGHSNASNTWVNFDELAGFVRRRYNTNKFLETEIHQSLYKYKYVHPIGSVMAIGYNEEDQWKAYNLHVLLLKGNSFVPREKWLVFHFYDHLKRWWTTVDEIYLQDRKSRTSWVFRASDYYRAIRTFLQGIVATPRREGWLRWFEGIVWGKDEKPLATRELIVSPWRDQQIVYCVWNGLAFPSPKFENKEVKEAVANYTKCRYRNPVTIGADTWVQSWVNWKVEREAWRSEALLGLGTKVFDETRVRYFSKFFDPENVISKWSTWGSRQLIPGWAFITPYTSRQRYTEVGKVDIALVVVLVASLGSIFSAVNYVITYRYLGAPLLKNRRELRPFFVDSLIVASRMMIAANPALIIGIILLLSDRHFNTSFFDFSGGGDAVLFQHLFWFFGHPEVYIIILPCFGFMNSLLPFYLRKRLSGRLSLQFSMYTIALMGFAVWGHHMYMVGLANSVRTLYSTMTVMISVPASTKVLHWCVTLIQSTPITDVSFFFLLNFMYFFVLGGLSGMLVAHIGFDTLFHDTFYVIGHFHVMLSGAAVSCILAGFYFYFSSIFGVRYSRVFAYAHYIFFTVGQILTLVPMFWLGYAGMPRRVMDYPAAFGGWHSLASSGHLITLISFIFFLLMLIDSLLEGRAPVRPTYGVGRLNTRLGFYVYEQRKLQHWQQKALTLPVNKPSLANSLYHHTYGSELPVFTYTFRRI